jgi:hypothetical protein
MTETTSTPSSSAQVVLVPRRTMIATTAATTASRKTTSVTPGPAPVGELRATTPPMYPAEATRHITAIPAYPSNRAEPVRKAPAGFKP